MSPDELMAIAIEYGLHGWPVFPLSGKVPFKGTHGVLDATTDPAIIAEWWGSRYRGANIGGQIPAAMFMLDIDPYHGGDERLAALVQQHGPLPQTLTDLSGRGDGGAHYFYRRPAGKLSSTRLGRGLDIKDSNGYGVLPPSVHPDTGKPYTRIERPVAAPPNWLVHLLLPEPAPIPKTSKIPRLTRFWGPSIADEYSANSSWIDVLAPHGWRCDAANPDADGAKWLHPTATSACSATVKKGCLFVYSPNTPFDITEPSNPKGYTRFRAYAVLNFDGDMSAAARALREAA